MATTVDMCKLATIMFTDMVSFTRQMGADETRTLRLNPQFSLEGVRQTSAAKDPAALERYIAAARKAGLK